VTFRTAEEHAGNADIHAGLIFYASDTSGLPGYVKSAEEFERVDATNGDFLLMYSPTGQGWPVFLNQTTVSL